MHWAAWAILGLSAIGGGWMAFDGLRALLGGDYVTFRTGPYAGQLGPWSILVHAVGLEPRSLLMKSLFVAFGVTKLVSLAGFGFGFSWGWWGLLFTSFLTLWYLPIGTLVNIFTIVLLLLPNIKAVWLH